jgi:hypothetical protein
MSLGLGIGHQERRGFAFGPCGDKRQLVGDVVVEACAAEAAVALRPGVVVGHDNEVLKLTEPVERWRECQRSTNDSTAGVIVVSIFMVAFSGHSRPVR